MATRPEPFFDTEWAIDTPHEHVGTGSRWAPFQDGSYDPYSYHDDSQDVPSVRFQKGHVYHGEGYFDSAIEPHYHYQDPWNAQSESHSNAEARVPFSAPQSPSNDHAHVTYGDSRTYRTPSHHTTSSFHGDIHGQSSNPFSTPPFNAVPHYLATGIPSFSEVGASSQGAFDLPGAAHQPVAPSQRSNHSELFVNLQFMERLRVEEQAKSQCHPVCSPVLTPTTSESCGAPSPAPSNAPPVHSHLETETQDRHLSASAAFLGMSIPEGRASLPAWMPSHNHKREEKKVTPPSPLQPSPGSSRSSPSRPSPAKKTPASACFFCKERKIACRPPDENSDEKRCNQCVLRDFKCVFPKERLTRRPRPRK